MKTDAAATGTPWAVIFAGLCFLAAAALDVATPSLFEAGLLYLPAIALAARGGGRTPAIALAILVWVLRLLAESDLSAAAVWSACSWLGVYLFVGLLSNRLRLASEQQQRLARTDPLTGLANRRAALEAIDAEINRGTRHQTPLTVAYVDFDDFKQVNDRRGHAVGDRLLQAAAEAMRRGTRSYDVVARPGGDEFLIVLPATAADEARRVVSRLQDQLNRAMRKNGWDATFSIGAATYAGPPESAAAAVQRADELMYAVKQAGKNGAQFGTFGGESTL